MTDITSDIGPMGGGTNGTPHPDAEGRDRTIGNPVSWAVQGLGRASSHAAETVEEMRSDSAAHPEVRSLTMEDLRAALAAGWSDFTAARSDAMFLVFIYPLIGVAMVSLGFQLEMIPLLFPMIMGFALIGRWRRLAFTRCRDGAKPGRTSAGWRRSRFCALRRLDRFSCWGCIWAACSWAGCWQHSSSMC